MDFSGFEKLSLVDFDNQIGCTLFTSRCQFRCPFCHNSPLVIDASNQPVIPFDEIMSYLKKRAGVIEGVIISGGEPTLMDDLEDKIRQIRDLGYKIKLDTNGYNPSILKDLVNKGLIDYVAMDIKNSKKKYAVTCGLDYLDSRRIEESIEFLLSGVVEYEFRTTLINEFHDYEDMRDIAKMINGASRYVLQRFIDNHCIQDGLHEVPLKKAQEFLDLVKSSVKEAKLRGYDI